MHVGHYEKTQYEFWKWSMNRWYEPLVYKVRLYIRQLRLGPQVHVVGSRHKQQIAHHAGIRLPQEKTIMNPISKFNLGTSKSSAPHLKVVCSSRSRSRWNCENCTNTIVLYNNAGASESGSPLVTEIWPIHCSRIRTGTISVEIWRQKSAWTIWVKTKPGSQEYLP